LSPVMRAWLGSWVISCVAAGVFAAACGGEVTVDGVGGTAGTGGSGATGGSGGKGGTGGSAVKDAGKDADTGADREPDIYVDPGCPDAPPPPVVWECDPFAASSGCAFGEACYPFVDEPGGTGCGWDQYGTICALAGVGRQGESCGAANGCAAGFLCVKGAQPGLSCVKLCDPFGPNTCPQGMICGAVDVEGSGGCY
jgi:hypothetical protein